MTNSNYPQSDSERQARRRLRRLRARFFRVSRILFVFFFLVFVICLGLLIWKNHQDQKEKDAFRELSALIDLPVTQATEAPTAEDQPTENPDGPSDPVMLGRYLALYERNPDLFGWISIDGTDVNYPVMYTPEDPEYYLRRAFDGSYSRSGVPFLDGDCFSGCGNYIIYGHNMFNGTMFSELTSYADQAFWEEHPVIHFDTLYQEGEYQVVSAFYSRVFYEYEENVFRYYSYPDLTDPEVFEEYVNQVLSSARYDTGVLPEYGDELITLITCSYGSENERFVVVACKKSDDRIAPRQ